MNKQDSNYLLPVLSSIAGLGTVLAAISPLILQAKYFKNIFIDQQSISFASVISFVIIVIIFALTYSIRSYTTLQGLNQEKLKIWSILLFSFLSINFYSAKILVNVKLMDPSFGSIIQIYLYILSFIFLSTAIGLLLRDGLGSYQWKKTEETKMDKIRETLIKAGRVKIDLQIDSMGTRPYQAGDPPEAMNAKEIFFHTAGKQYQAIISSDYNTLLLCNPIPSESDETQEEIPQKTKKR